MTELAAHGQERVGRVQVSRARSGVREWLATETAEVHRALHVHPLLGALQRRDLTEPAYHAALRVFLNVFAATDERRSALNVYDRFALTREVEALRGDLAGATPDATICVGDWMTDAPSAIGALYAAHGSAFGRKSIARNIAAVFPHARAHYFSLAADSGAWRRLLQEVERCGARSAGDRDALRCGAFHLFELVRQQADASQARSSAVPRQA